MRWEVGATVRQLPRPAAITILPLADRQDANANILPGVTSWVLALCRFIVWLLIEFQIRRHESGLP